MRFAPLLIAVTILPCHSAPDPNVVLDQARPRLRAMARRLDEYVCIETVDRSYFRPPATPASPAACGQNAGPQQLESNDRVRFEVTVEHGRELHSWPGARGFDVRDVDELVGDGPVSTGAFGAFLASVFDHPGVEFHFIGEHTSNGRTAYQYGFSVPIQASSFRIRVGTEWRPAGYEGAFDLDPQSLQLESLTIRTTELPAGAPFCAATDTLDYQPIHIGDSDVLLPRQSRLEVARQSGAGSRNVTRFSNCREYQAESEIVFDLPADAGIAAPRAGRSPRVELPIGLPVTLSLAEPIDTALAAAGDPISAKIVNPVRLPGSSEDLIPAGAIVRGRIRRVEHHLSPAPYFLLALAFNRVEVEGVVSPFAARSEPAKLLAKKLDARLDIRAPGIWFWDVGTFLFPSHKDHIVVPAGFESKWFTLDAGQ
jgi:hypothetical protein